MSRDNVACVTSNPRRRSLRRSSSWFATSACATSSRIALCLWNFIFSFRTKQKRGSQSQPRLHKYTQKLYKYASGFFPLPAYGITQVACLFSSCEFELDFADAQRPSRAVRPPLPARLSWQFEQNSQLHEIFKGRIVEYGLPLPAFIPSYVHRSGKVRSGRLVRAIALLY